MTNKALLRNLYYELELLKMLRADNKGKETYVVANNRYVHVIEGWGLNGTEFNTICPLNAPRASIFYSIRDAKERGFGYHFEDEPTNTEELEIIKATEFYSYMIDETKDCIKVLEKELES